jgi:hypothetical protein
MAERRIRARIDPVGELSMASQHIPVEVLRAFKVGPSLLRELLAEGRQ